MIASSCCSYSTTKCHIFNWQFFIFASSHALIQCIACYNVFFLCLKKMLQSPFPGKLSDHWSHKWFSSASEVEHVMFVLSPMGCQNCFQNWNLVCIRKFWVCSTDSRSMAGLFTNNWYRADIVWKYIHSRIMPYHLTRNKVNGGKMDKICQFWVWNLKK